MGRAYVGGEKGSVDEKTMKEINGVGFGRREKGEGSRWTYQGRDASSVRVCSHNSLSFLGIEQVDVVAQRK